MALEHISSEKALEFECPWCFMPPGRWCVYVPPKAVFVNPRKTPAASVQLQRERAGTQTTTIHNGRFNAAREALYKERLKAARARPQFASFMELMRVRKAWRDWDVAEYQALRAWFKQHGQLFTSLGPRSR